MLRKFRWQAKLELRDIPFFQNVKLTSQIAEFSESYYKKS